MAAHTPLANTLATTFGGTNERLNPISPRARGVRRPESRIHFHSSHAVSNPAAMHKPTGMLTTSAWCATSISVARVLETRAMRPRVLRALARVVFAKRGESPARVQDVVATGRDAILVVGVPVHEGLDRDAEDVARAHEAPSDTGREPRKSSLRPRSHDSTHLLAPELGLVGDVAHHALEVDVAREVEEEPEAAHEERDPSAVRMAAGNGHEIALACATCESRRHALYRVGECRPVHGIGFDLVAAREECGLQGDQPHVAPLRTLAHHPSDLALVDSGGKRHRELHRHVQAFQAGEQPVAYPFRARAAQ